MKNKIGVSAGLLSGMFWGFGLAISAYIFSLYNVSPFAVAVIHDFISIFVLLAIILVKYKTINFKIFTNIKSVSVIVGALLAGPIGMQCNLYAVKYIGSGLTSSITAIYPAVSVILAVIFLKNKVSSKTLLGIALIIVGIFIQSYKSEQVESFYLGFMFALICAVAWGSESVLSSYAMKNNLNELETLLIRQVTSFLAYLVIISFNGLGIETSLDVKFGGLIVFFVVSNMVSYILYYMAINKLEPAKATGLNVSYVVWTILFSMIFVALEVNLQLVVTSIIRPMTDNTPKALIKVKDKPLVEYQIEFLKEKGIDEIIVVVGYLHEQFDYLKEKYNVELVFNKKYAEYNNFYSLYLVKEKLADSYVIDADNYLFKNMFRTDIDRSTYFSVYREDCENEWFLIYGDDYKVQDIIVDSKAGRILSGVSFWDKKTAEKIVSFIDKAYESNEFMNLYWDNMVKDNIKKLDVYVEELEHNSIYEIDSVKDYNKLEEILKEECER